MYDFPDNENGFCHSGVASHILGMASYTGAINTHKVWATSAREVVASLTKIMAS